MITKTQIEILKNEFNFDTEPKIQEKLNLWFEIFIEYNSHTNLMSKNDINVLFEKHIFDSLAILKWEKFLSIKKILDVGCGGGFPSVILAVFFPKIKIIANDSRIKKINFIKHAKEILKLDNLEILYGRIEQAKVQNTDLIVSRAMGKILDVYELSKKHISKSGNFIFYKAKTAQDEIMEFQKKYDIKNIEILPYTLPLEENFKRNLVIIKAQ